MRSPLGCAMVVLGVIMCRADAAQRPNVLLIVSDDQAEPRGPFRDY